MDLQLNWINLIILFGGLHGLAFSIILLFNKKHPGARYLSGMMFVLAYNSFETFNWSAGLNLEFFALFPYVFIFGIGPFLFFYIQSALHPGRRFTKRQLLIHYSPLLFQLVLRLALITYDFADRKFLLTPVVPLGTIEYWHFFISEPLSVIFFLFYLVISIRAYRQFVTKDFKHTEYNQRVRTWAKALLLVMTCLGIMWPVTIIIPYIIEIAFNAHYYPIEIVLVFVIYWIAMRGYHKTQIIYRKENALFVPDGKADEVMVHLERAMTEDRLFLEPELTLAKISTHIGVPAKTISAVVNQVTGKTVNEFVNRYRVERVKEKLAEPGNDHLTIAGIALECGFNSQPTFQRAFRQHTGMSPTEYLNSQNKP